jgi:hypothetical protein
MHDGAPLNGLPVEDDAALPDGGLAGKGHHNRRRVLRSHRIDLEDRGAKLDEDTSTSGAGHDVGRVDHGEASQRRALVAVPGSHERCRVLRLGIASARRQDSRAG